MSRELPPSDGRVEQRVEGQVGKRVENRLESRGDTALRSGPAEVPGTDAPDAAAVPPGVPAAPESPVPAARRPAGDPVKGLMHRHRALCERAVDPLEIAAGLESHGITDRAAARYRHRDVFSLAEEMYARVPRGAAGSVPARAVPDRGRTARFGGHLLALLPGLACVLAVAGLELAHGGLRFTLTTAAVSALLLLLAPVLARGPLSGRHRFTTGSRLWICWLAVYLLAGDGFLAAAVAGGPDGPGALATAPAVALALGLAPAVWCAGLYGAAARRRLATSRSFAEFAASMRPLLLGTVLLFLVALLGLLQASSELLAQEPRFVGALTLGALLLTARMLLVRGFTHAPAVMLGVAGAGEGLALTLVLAGRLPGCEPLAVPVEYLVSHHGAETVPALCCGLAALVLLAHAMRTLTRASAHASP